MNSTPVLRNITMETCMISKVKLPLFVNTLGTKVIAYRDTRALPQATVRHAECSLLLPQSAESDRCETCRNYSKTLNRALIRKSKATTTTTSHTQRCQPLLLCLSETGCRKAWDRLPKCEIARPHPQNWPNVMKCMLILWQNWYILYTMSPFLPSYWRYRNCKPSCNCRTIA